MKTSRTAALVLVALVSGFLAAYWTGAQPSNHSSVKEPTSYDFGALEQLQSFVSYLQDTGQTNTLQRFNDYANASMASRNYADLGLTLGILQRLRAGQREAAFELLEGKLSSDIIGFAAVYRDLPKPLREQTSLKVLGNARAYRRKVPFKDRYPNNDQKVTEAFELLDERAK